MIKRLLFIISLAVTLQIQAQNSTPITGWILDASTVQDYTDLQLKLQLESLMNQQNQGNKNNPTDESAKTDFRGLAAEIYYTGTNPSKSKKKIISSEEGIFTIPSTYSNGDPFIVSFDGENYKVTYSGENPWILRVTIKADRIDGVNIKKNKLKEKLKESPLTVESMSANSIKETPASDFYEALGHLKGVDVTAASLGFRVINTRGFNSTSPVRTLQIIDGVDNQSPGLNFSLGNFLGASELDIANQEIVVGASSAYYGPGAFNGVISMTTKSPWTTPGFSFKTKIGERGLNEYSMRFAKVLKTKKGREVFAYKINGYYMKAYDWVADNADPSTDSKDGKDNLFGYDAVNKYGDEFIRGNDKTNRGGLYTVPGLGRYYREGYWEKDLVDYNTYNYKTSATFCWRPTKNKNTELQYQINIGGGTTVYQGDNRYSLRDIIFLQNRLELKQKNGFVRVYSTNEDAGHTYDAVFTAQLLQNYAKKDNLWSGDAYSIWLNSYASKVKKLPGYPDETRWDPFSTNQLVRDTFYMKVNECLNANKNQLQIWMQEDRARANKWHDFKGLPFAQQPQTFNRFEPGTDRFDSMKRAITNRKSFGEGGSGFYDKSALYNLQAEHHWRLGLKATLTAGLSSRLYIPKTAGTIFSDTNGRIIKSYEYGIYLGSEYKLKGNKLKLNGTIRVDKNKNFNYIYSPAVSLVYTPDKLTYFRVSLTSGVRNPTMADQYLYYNVGRAILLGNLKGYDSLVTVQSVYDAMAGLQPNLGLLKWFKVNPVRPEIVRSVELGYKSFLLKNSLSFDGSVYFNYYKDFIGYKIGFDPIIGFGSIQGGQAYRIATNAETGVTTTGLSAGFYYSLTEIFTVGGNYSFNTLIKLKDYDPIIPAFNTPKNKFNLSLICSNYSLKIGNKKIEGLGFSINYKWIEGFVFEGSPQFTGAVPTYFLLDAMVSKEIVHSMKIQKPGAPNSNNRGWNAQVKLGASNLTNNLVYQVYGGPRIGRLAYISVMMNFN